MKSVYIHLFHGRKDPAEDLEDWGSDGPFLGPLDFVHFTYMNAPRLMRTHDEKGYPLAGDDPRLVEDWFCQYDDLIYYDGVFYGDFSIHADADDHARTFGRTPEQFDPNKAKLPEKWRKHQQEPVERLLWEFLLEFDGCDRAEKLWNKLREYGVSRSAVEDSVKQMQRKRNE